MVNFPSFAVTPIITVKNGRIKVTLDRISDRKTVIDILEKVKDISVGVPLFYARINILLIVPKSERSKVQ